MEEVSALAAIFCGPNEFKFISQDSPVIFELDIASVVQADFKFQLRVTLDSAYPVVLPHVMIHSSRLDYEGGQAVIQSLKAHFRGLLGTPILLDMVQWCQEHVHWHATSPSAPAISADDIRNELLLRIFLIDHVRNEKIYHKTLDKLCRECDCGALLIWLQGKTIYLMVGGESQAVKEFSKCFSQVNIDLDSQARPCKERMKTLLCSISYYPGDFSARGFSASKDPLLTFHEYLSQCSAVSTDLRSKIMSIMK
ncbi:hypothetical protein TCAL_02816 [Tigriopus californicus]|uniref:RWD domain-containing protein 3 n=1 Tax=Tigriopus californicus TaxID=6832 RepID=A0A553NX31_TIGCA|nr:RWD domain-containing protein 3-like [Tigriopus californicus]TRY69995.1 hypothetical protein TCAL_02816 [Tigriopus californicus]